MIKQIKIYETQYVSWYIKTDIDTKEYLDILDRIVIEKLNEVIRKYNKLEEEYNKLKKEVIKSEVKY